MASTASKLYLCIELLIRYFPVKRHMVLMYIYIYIYITVVQRLYFYIYIRSDIVRRLPSKIYRACSPVIYL